MKKPIVIDRPWWRHPIFPWGWYSLRKDIDPNNAERVTLSGYYMPGDAGYGAVYSVIRQQEHDDSGIVITPTGGDMAIPVTLTRDELNLVRQWFDSLQDTNPGYLERDDYVLAEKIYKQLGMRVPLSITEKIEG